MPRLGNPFIYSVYSLIGSTSSLPSTISSSVVPTRVSLVVRPMAQQPPRNTSSICLPMRSASTKASSLSWMHSASYLIMSSKRQVDSFKPFYQLINWGHWNSSNRGSRCRMSSLADSALSTTLMTCLSGLRHASTIWRSYRIWYWWVF